MPPPRLYVGDEELGKKDDDHKPGSKSPMGFLWQQRRPHVRNRSIKRVVLAIITLVAFYLFFKNMPTDLRNPRQRPHYDRPGTVSKPSPDRNAVLPGSPSAEESSQHYLNGPIKFYELAESLHAVGPTRGSELINRNVLFAASSLKSAAALLPIACEMAMKNRNYIHFAFMGRDDIPLSMLKAVNGVTKECKIIFHDGRPDFSVHSSDYRMEVSASAGLSHINTFVHPQAILVDGSSAEDQFFLRAFRDRTGWLGVTLIELPENAEQNLMWLTELDSSSLNAWTKISVDIVVHAPQESSGGIIRLLNSLKKADYSSSAPPRLTIELPHTVDQATRSYLQNFKWPPERNQNEGSLLTIHHRIPQQSLTEEGNSIRFLESFWPQDPMVSHVLVLSPQAELSPLFFHYLKYTILEYRYSPTKKDDRLLGISLDRPSTYLNDSAIFIPPKQAANMPFLWQAPNSNAMLYFGDKWVELHDLVTRILGNSHYSSPPSPSTEKLVSKTYPSWLEHILRLARARAYWTLYPNFDTSDSLATLHNELYQPPEEYAENKELTNPDFTADPAQHLSLKHTEEPLLLTSLQSLIPKLPLISEMALLSWDGDHIHRDDMLVHASKYRKIFRSEIGGCNPQAKEKGRIEMTAWDLFCTGDEELVEAEDMKTGDLVKFLEN